MSQSRVLQIYLCRKSGNPLKHHELQSGIPRFMFHEIHRLQIAGDHTCPQGSVSLVRAIHAE
jgi:hypothetical protein